MIKQLWYSLMEYTYDLREPFNKINMFNKIRRKLWISKYFYNRLMAEEVKLALELKFISEAEEQILKMANAIETEETWLAEQPESHKYEDRQAKIRAEKKLRMLKETLKVQEKHLTDGKRAIEIIKDNLTIIEENGKYLKDVF